MVCCLDPGWQARGQLMAQTARLRRRIAGILSARLPGLQLEQVPGPRSARGKRGQLTALLTTVLAGMLAGCTSLLGVEQLTEFMTRAASRLLGIARRLPDTTTRTALCALMPDAIRPVIHRQILAAHRRKSLGLNGLPIGVVAIDGKSNAPPRPPPSLPRQGCAPLGACPRSSRRAMASDPSPGRASAPSTRTSGTATNHRRSGGAAQGVTMPTRRRLRAQRTL